MVSDYQFISYWVRHGTCNSRPFGILVLLELHRLHRSFPGRTEIRCLKWGTTWNSVADIRQERIRVGRSRKRLRVMIQRDGAE